MRSASLTAVLGPTLAGLSLVGCSRATEPGDAAHPATTAPAVSSPAADPLSTTSSPPAPVTVAPAPTTRATTEPVELTLPTTTLPPTSQTTAAPSLPTLPRPDAGTDAQLLERQVVGESVNGRPIVAVRRGTPGGRVVLVVGVIHGDEDAGLAILERLHADEVPDGVDLWLVDSMNPDGVAARTRQNANHVDLNRNFPHNWAPLGEFGSWQYAGPSPASEPEVQAMMAFMLELRPELTLWYHQDYFRIAPARGRDGEIRRRYSELTELPLLPITGGTYTGSAASWARATLDPGVAFIVELGPTLSEREAEAHAKAVLTIAEELDEF